MVWLDSRGRSRKEPAGVLSAAGEGEEGSGVRGNSKGRWMALATGKTGRGWDLCLPQGSLVIQQTVHSLATVREAGPFPGLVSTTPHGYGDCAEGPQTPGDEQNTSNSSLSKISPAEAAQALIYSDICIFIFLCLKLQEKEVSTRPALSRGFSPSP